MHSVCNQTPDMQAFCLNYQYSCIKVVVENYMYIVYLVYAN